MTTQETSRTRGIVLIVLAVIVVGLGAMLLIGLLLGDGTDDPPSGKVIVLSPGAWR